MEKGWPILLFLFFLTSPVPLAHAAPFEARTFDGTGNNPYHPEFGSAGVALLRLADAEYADRIGEPARPNARSAREISNILMAQTESVLNRLRASDFVWQWGQFLDHDLDLSPEAYPEEPFFIPVPPGDPYFDPEGTGNRYIALQRSSYLGGDSRHNPRQQINALTAYIDTSQVYGSDPVRAGILRTYEGGKLRTTSGGLYLPFEEEGLKSAAALGTSFFLAGDVRVNEQIALTAMHTLFVREHNRLCDIIAAAGPLTDEEIYQRARKIVGALMQVITYQEFLPALLGPDVLSPYKGYNPKVNSGIANEFATVAFRLGHTLLSPELNRINMPGYELVSTSLKDAFFNPRLIFVGGGIDSLLRGLAAQQAQAFDPLIVDGLRNFLFGEPGEGGFDLAALNIQRGRDHGIADYNHLRKAYGLKPLRNFYEITGDPDRRAKLAQAFGSVDGMDPWPACLAEDPLPGCLVGETIFTSWSTSSSA